MTSANDLADIIGRLKEPADRGAVVCSLAGMTVADIGATSINRLVPGWKPPESYGHGKAITRDQASELLSLAESKRDWAILYLAVVVGLRQIEIRRLTWSAVLPGNHVRVIGKGGKRRTVPVGRDLAEIFPPRGNGEEYVFKRLHHPLPSQCKRPKKSQLGMISESGMRMIIVKYLSQVAPDSSPHALRHTALTWMLEGGTDIRTAMEIAGHSSISSHEIYAATSSSWLIREWLAKSPLSGLDYPVKYTAYPGVEDFSAEGVMTINVPGKPFSGHISRGTERAVIIPSVSVGDVAAALSYFKNSKQLTNRGRKIGVRFKEIRDSGAIALTDNQAHPFLVAMVMGTTPGNVIRRSFDRKTDSVLQAKESAVEMAGAHLDPFSEMVAGLPAVFDQQGPIA